MSELNGLSPKNTNIEYSKKDVSNAIKNLQKLTNRKIRLKPGTGFSLYAKSYEFLELEKKEKDADK